MYWLLSKLLRRRIVWLIGYEGRVYKTLAYQHPDGRRVCAPVYFFQNVGHVWLHEDGTTSGSACYIARWAAEKPPIVPVRKECPKHGG